MQFPVDTRRKLNLLCIRRSMYVFCLQGWYLCSVKLDTIKGQWSPFKTVYATYTLSMLQEEVFLVIEETFSGY